jgi:hypothetical protein
MDTYRFKRIIEKAAKIADADCDFCNDVYGKIPTEIEVCRRIFDTLSTAIDEVLKEVEAGDGTVAV